jgi:hypothetical protein
METAMTRLIRSLPLLLATALPLAACGDNGDDAGDDDDAPDAAVAPDADPATPTARVAVVASDFTSGVFSTIDAPSLAVDAAAVAGVASADPVIRRHGDELFIVNRFGFDNVTILDAATLTLVTQISTGEGSNPQDVAVVGDKLYVAALGADGIRVIDRDAPTEIDSIDLTKLDGDGVPDCMSVHAVGDRVFAACGLLDNFVADQVGKVVVIDTTTDTVETTFDLPARNPAGLLEQAPAGSAYAGDLLLATVPDYVDYATGCLVRISTGDTPAATCGPTNLALGGFVTRVGFAGDVTWVIAAAFSPSFESTGALHAIDAEGTVGAAATGAAVVAQDLAVCGDYLFVADKATTGEGVRVFAHDGETVSELTTDVLDVGTTPIAGNGLACADAP